MKLGKIDVLSLKLDVLLKNLIMFQRKFEDFEYAEITKEFNLIDKIKFLLKLTYLYKVYLNFIFIIFKKFVRGNIKFLNIFDFFFKLSVEADLIRKKKIIKIGERFIKRKFQKLFFEQNLKKKNIAIFVCTRDIFKSIKFAAKFKEKKYQTILITKLEASYRLNNEKKIFDKIISLESYVSIYWLTKFLKFKILYFNCEMFDLHICKFLNFEKKALKIADFSDQTWCFLQNKKILKNYFGIKNIKSDILYHKMIIKKFDIIYHNWASKFSQEIINFFKLSKKESLKIKHISHNVVNARVQTFQIKKKKRNNLVWAGQIVSENLPENIFPARSLGDTFSELSKNNFKVHAFQNPQFSKNFLHTNNFSKYIELEKKKKLTLYRYGADYSQLNYILKKFDFGLILFNTAKLYNHSKIKLDNVIPFKFYSYIESSIPIIVNNEFTHLSYLIKKYKIGLSINYNQINTLEKKIKNCDYECLKKNVKIFQKKYSFEDFFEKEFFYYRKI